MTIAVDYTVNFTDLAADSENTDEVSNDEWQEVFDDFRSALQVHENVATGMAIGPVTIRDFRGNPVMSNATVRIAGYFEKDSSTDGLDATSHCVILDGIGIAQIVRDWK